MRKGLLACVTTLLAGAGAALAQGPAPVPVAPAIEDRSSILTLPSSQPDGNVRVIEAPVHTPGRFYADAEYLLWFSRGDKLPPLITSGGPADVATTASLGQPNTVVLFGDKDVNGEARSGIRVRAGLWLNDEQAVGVEADGFLLQRLGAGGTFPPSGLLLGRPFVNPAIDPLFGNPETALLLASNGLFTGGASVSTSNTFWGVELNGRFGLTGNSWYRADLLAGFRYVSLGEGLNVGSTVTALPDGLVTFQGSPVLAPASVAVLDSFRTRNDFYGAQIGTVVEFQKGMWFADWRALLAAGVVRQSLTISGATSLITPTDITTVPGGLLAQASNIGRFARNEFGIVPETGLSVGCQVASFLRVYAGYSVLYMRQDVLRPGTSIDRSVQVTQIPSLSPAPTGTETLPGVILRNVDYWVQGVHFGVELTF